MGIPTTKRKVAINGFGRVGRAAFKAALENKNIQIVAINDLTDPKTLAHLLQYDTVYGKYPKKVTGSDKKPITDPNCVGSLQVDKKLFPVLAQKEPEKLPWRDLGVDVVIESTGFFTKGQDAAKHIKAGAKRVIISAPARPSAPASGGPAKDATTPTYVLGVNTQGGIKEEVISNSSCTTNSVAPVATTSCPPPPGRLLPPPKPFRN